MAQLVSSPPIYLSVANRMKLESHLAKQYRYEGFIFEILALFWHYRVYLSTTLDDKSTSGVMCILSHESK